ncbi:MAG: ATP-binding protein [Sphingomonadales bacterium]
MNLDIEMVLLGFVLGTIVAAVPLAIWFRSAIRDARASATPTATEDADLRDLVEHPDLESIAADLPDMVVVVGPDRVRRYISAACEKLLGYPPEEMIGQSPINGIHPDDRAATMVASEKLFQGAVPRTLTTYRHKHRDGHYVWLEAHFASRRVPETDELQDFVGIVRDIGARRREKLLDSERNARMRENNRLLQMAEGIANIGHWRIDVQEDSLFWSEQLFRIHGVSDDFVPDLEKGIDFYYEEDRPMVTEAVEKALNEGEDFEFTARIVRPNGELRHVATIGHAESSPTGEVVTVFGVFKDITETVLIEERLRQSRDAAEDAAKAKTHFLANMSHEIRTPMNGVIGFADLLLESDLSEEHLEYARMISDSGKAMLRLLNELLDLSKIEAGRMQLSREPVDFGHLVRSSVRLFEPNAKAKGIVLEADIASGMPTGTGDKLRVRQIILNLIGNAIKFTDQGSVRIVAQEEDGSIVIRVIDTGVGIPADKLSHVFDEFAQIEGASASSVAGTGLGLAIARQLTELMGGSLTATSELGQGSTFVLSLPLVECEGNAPDAPAQKQDAASFRKTLTGRRVLLAEDVDINRKLAVAMLGRLGVAVEIAEDGKQAVEKVRAAREQGRPFDAVLMDMQMPVMDGLEATRTLRAEGVSERDLPILAITANAYPDDIELCLAAGMQDHVAKPISIERLGPCLEKWLVTNPAAEVEEASASDEDAEARQMYEQRRSALRTQLAELSGPTPPTAEQREKLREQLHVMAGIAAYFGDEDLGNLARRVERDLKGKANEATVQRGLDELRGWFNR